MDIYFPLCKTNAYIRPLCLNDINSEYLSWFSDPYVLKYISFASSTPSLESLTLYAKTKIESPLCIFLGIYDSSTNQIVGTIKLEPLDVINGTAEIGILIGLPLHRGRGVASEALSAVFNYAKSSLGLFQLTLGVSKSNTPAIRLYQKLGFKITSSSSSAYRMILIF